MNQKHLQNIHHVNVNVNLMLENITQIKNGLMTNLDVGARIQENTIYAKNS